MGALQYLTPIFLCFLVSTVSCQEESEGGDTLWARIRDLWKSMVDEWKKIWKDFKEEVKARAADMGDFTQEMWDSMKKKLNEWVSSRNDIEESQKDEMRNYIERMQMPEEENNERKK